MAAPSDATYPNWYQEQTVVRIRPASHVYTSAASSFPIGPPHMKNPPSDRNNLQRVPECTTKLLTFTAVDKRSANIWRLLHLEKLGHS